MKLNFCKNISKYKIISILQVLKYKEIFKHTYIKLMNLVV
jgi:hypothetical protein